MQSTFLPVPGSPDRRARICFAALAAATIAMAARAQIVEQVIRPTGLVDPEVEVRPAAHQVDDLLQEIRERVQVNERVLVTTLTKRMAEDLTEYYRELGVRVRYLHSDVETLSRTVMTAGGLSRVFLRANSGSATTLARSVLSGWL